MPCSTGVCGTAEEWGCTCQGPFRDASVLKSNEVSISMRRQYTAVERRSAESGSLPRLPKHILDDPSVLVNPLRGDAERYIFRTVRRSID